MTNNEQKSQRNVLTTIAKIFGILAAIVAILTYFGLDWEFISTSTTYNVPNSTSSPEQTLLNHSNASVGTGIFADVTYSKGEASFSQAELQRNNMWDPLQTIRREEQPSGCDTVQHTTDLIWIQGTPGMEIALDNKVIGTYTANPNAHGYIVKASVSRGQEICAVNFGPQGFAIYLGPQIYNHYDTYCYRVESC
ncbi:MAG: hypothetical protein AAF902_06010 [Chloroflexota bacterium]